MEKNAQYAGSYHINKTTDRDNKDIDDQEDAYIVPAYYFTYRFL